MRLFSMSGIELCDPTDVRLIDDESMKVFVSFKGSLSITARRGLQRAELSRRLPHCAQAWRRRVREGSAGGGRGNAGECGHQVLKNTRIQYDLCYCYIVNAYEIDKVFKEVKALEKLSHCNIVRLKNSFPIKADNSVALVMEYASGGELLDFIVKRGHPTEEEAKIVFR